MKLGGGRESYAAFDISGYLGQRRYRDVAIIAAPLITIIIIITITNIIDTKVLMKGDFSHIHCLSLNHNP